MKEDPEYLKNNLESIQTKLQAVKKLRQKELEEKKVSLEKCIILSKKDNLGRLRNEVEV